MKNKIMKWDELTEKEKDELWKTYQTLCDEVLHSNKETQPKFTFKRFCKKCEKLFKPIGKHNHICDKCNRSNGK